MTVTPFIPPAGWIFLPQRPVGVEAIAVEPGDSDDPERFRSNLVLTVNPTDGLSFSDWQNGTDELLARTLYEFLIVDLERLEFNGRPAGRRLAHYTGPHGRALTMEQWFTQIDDVGRTLTATVETVRYDELADMLQVAAVLWGADL